MTHWPLLLPPLAVSASPSRSRHSSLSIVVKSPLHQSLTSSCHRAVHHRSAAPSITIHSPLPSPLPPIAVVLSVHVLCARAVPCRRRAVAHRPSPSRSRRAVPHRQGAVAPSLAPSRSRRAVHCHRGAVAPYLTIKEPSAVLTDNSDHSSCPSKPLVIRLVVASFLMLPPPICRRLSLQPLPFVPLVRPASCPFSLPRMPPPPICQRLRLSSRRRLLLSHPSRASRPAG